MKVIKKFTAIILNTQTVEDSSIFPKVNICLTYGKVEGTYYSQEYPEEEFDTEELAIEYAYRTDKYANWLIVPRISFNQFEE